MKSKINIKLLFFLAALVSLVLTILSIRGTYARYVTSLTAKSSVELGSWLIRVNNQDITSNPDLSSVLTPIFNSSDYIAEGKIVPTSIGSVEIKLDYQEVTVPFKYDISFNHDDATVLEDFKLTSYTIDGGEAVIIEDGNTVITDTISPDNTSRTRTLILNFTWLDGEGEVLDDIKDTEYSRNIDELAMRFDLEFTQLQPSS